MHLNCKRNKERSTGQSEQLKQDNGGVKALVFAVFPHQKALKWNESQQDTGDPPSPGAKESSCCRVFFHPGLGFDHW